MAEYQRSNRRNGPTGWNKMRVIRVLLALSCLILISVGPLPTHGASLPPLVACSSLTDFTGIGQYEVRRVSFLSGRLRIGALLQKPAGSGPFPAFIHTHGGVGRAFAMDLRFWSSSSRELRLVDANYAVLRVARRGHFGSEGMASAYQDEPSSLSVDQFERLLYEEATDVMAAFTFLGECPFVDPRRVAIGGHSTGGFITVVAAARLPNAAAVTNINGGISWIQGGVQHGWPVTRAMFVREAPKIKAPVLVLLGSRDEQLPPDIGLTLAEALRRQGSPVEVRVYMGGHVDWPVDALVEFLDKHLKPSRQ